MIANPSEPMIIELYRPTSPVESTVVVVFPEVQAILPHFTTLRSSKAPATKYETIGNPSVPMAIEVLSPTPTPGSMVVVLLTEEQEELAHLATLIELLLLS